MNPILQNIDNHLTNYLFYPGDNQETILQKKIWWIIHVAGLPLLLIGYSLISKEGGVGMLIMFQVFLALLLLDLVGFHFYRQNIEIWALAAQIGVVLISAITMLEGHLDPGLHTISMDTKSMPDCTYLYQIKTKEGIIVKKLIIQHPE